MEMFALSSAFRNRDEVLCALLAFFFSKMPNRITLLKRLEIGVFLFCWRTAIQAEVEDKSELAKILREQAESEYHHAQTFCTFTDNKFKWSVTKLFNNPDRSLSWGQVWDTSETFVADGLSRKYLSARIFFGDRYAKDFDWEDKLAFMAVLESYQACFYKKLLHFLPDSEIEPILTIYRQEAEHSATLVTALSEMVGMFVATDLMTKWKRRLYLALPFILLDLLGILTSVVTTKINATRTRFKSPKPRS